MSKLPAAQPLIIRPDKPLADRVQRISVYGVKVLMGRPPIKSLASPDVAGGSEPPSPIRGELSP